MNPRKSFWLRNAMVAAGVCLAIGAIRISRMQGRVTGGEAQVGCGGAPVDESAAGQKKQAIYEEGVNNLPPETIDTEALKRANTNAWLITSPSNPDPAPLCEGLPGTNSCNLKVEWKNWVDADPNIRKPLMKAITKCALPSTYSVAHPDGTNFPGQWGIYQSWKDSRLAGQDKRERMSSCILSLLNGLGNTLDICIIGPGGSPFSDACSDTQKYDLREGGFFGDLFASTPTAYVVGPQTDAVGSGRICGNPATGTDYCCPEDPALATAQNCTHKTIKAGGFGGPNGRCKKMAMAGPYEYCAEFYSTREPNRIYKDVFTTFVPSVIP